MEDKTENRIRSSMFLEIHHKKIDQSNYNDLCLKITNHSTSERLSLPLFTLTEESSLSDEIGRYRSKPSNDINTELLRSIDRKLTDMVFNMKKESLIKDFKTGIIQDLSDKDASILTSEIFDLEDSLLLRLLIPPYPGIYVDILTQLTANLKNSSTSNKQKYRLVFKAIHPHDKELLIKYLLKREREFIRSTRQNNHDSPSS